MCHWVIRWMVLFVCPNAWLLSAAEPANTTLVVPHWNEAITVDGRLNETCYQQHPPLTHFVNAAAPAAKLPTTKAWVFWSEDRLTLAFECEDATPADAPPTAEENDVNPQDRGELFLWSGRKDDPYYCLELASQGAVHDYRAVFYRKFDNHWTPAGLQTQVQSTSTGYTLEATLSRAELTKIGLEMKPGQVWRAGLFRADYDKLGGVPTWITWVNAKTPEPDFHVAEAFGIFEFAAP